ncbi:hypothetical protein ZTR_10344 [Talaromyces verruculosus]|nr:hypothetical protein ZTR_10344 [Talaromyces verruculosus]
MNAMQTPWLNWWTDANQENPKANLGKWMGVYAAFSILSLCFLGLNGAYLLITIIPKSSNLLHLKTLESTMRAPITYLSNKTVASILNLFTQDMTLIDMPLPIALILATGCFGNSIAGAILISVSSGYMAISMPILFTTLYFLQKIYLRTSQQLRLLDLEAKAPLLEHFMETLQGLTTIRALSWTDYLTSEAFHQLDQSQKPFYLLLCIQRWLTLVLNCVVAGLAVVLMTLTATLRGNTNSGFLGVSMVSVVNFGQTLSSFILYWTTLETSLTAISRIQNYVSETPEENSTSLIAELPSEWPVEPSIKIQHVSASYQKTGPDVLKDINISILPGKHVAICGRSGSGKSTLISVILRLLEPSKGSVIIGSKDISLYTQQAICKRVTSMPQDAWFAPRNCGDSVRENLDPLQEIRDDVEIYNVLDKIGLREQIDQIGGLDAKLKQGDGVLSEGQKQLFCLARAMLTRRGGVFIMDEAMSSVDYKTELRMLSLLRAEFQGWTIIAIVHRLRFISQFFDEVVVMEDGRVLEYDEPERLLSGHSSLFRQMTEAENGSAEDA